MELTPEVKAKIDSADYATLLEAWRHLPSDTGGLFEGESGRYFAARRHLCERPQVVKKLTWPPVNRLAGLHATWPLGKPPSLPECSKT